MRMNRQMENQDNCQVKIKYLEIWKFTKFESDYVT